MTPGLSADIPVSFPRSTKKLDIGQNVASIVKHKGPFHTVTAQSILDHKQDASLDLNLGSQGQASKDEKTALTNEQRQQQLTQKGHEYLQTLQQHANDLFQLLDATSLMLSSNSAAAVSTVSPDLLRVAPVGSLTTRKIQYKEPAKDLRRRAHEISVSRRVQSYSKAASSLMAASARLDEESSRQQSYWQKMSDMKNSKFPISRVPNQEGVIVIHYGCAESAPSYRARGMSIVRRDGNGDVILEKRDESQHPRTLSVRIRRNGRPTGTYTDMSLSTSAVSGLDREVRHAQETLFLDELWDEVSREARLLVNFGVAVRSDSVKFAINPDSGSDETIEVELLYSAQKQIDVSDMSDADQADDELAQFARNSLSLLLLAEHEKRHRARSSQAPAPLTLQPRVSSEAAILRPLMTKLRHSMEVHEISQVAASLRAVLSKADLTSQHNEDFTSSVSQENVLTVETLRRACNTIELINLPTGAHLVLQIDSFLGSPQFGTQFSMTMSHAGETKPVLSPTSKVAILKSSLFEVVCTDIAQRITQTGLDGVTWHTDAIDPIRMVLYKKEVALAKLEVSITSTQLKAKFRRKDVESGTIEVTWSETGSQSTQYDHKGEQDGASTSNETSLLQLVESWTQIATG